jgi:hypothetical protein
VGGSFHCEVIGRLVVARLLDEPTERVFEECQEEIIRFVKASGVRAVLYDLRNMTPPPTKVVLRQQALESEIRPFGLQRAIVVPNVSIGYLARLAFTGGECRVFYDDYLAAIRSLTDESGAVAGWRLTVREERRVRERRADLQRSGVGRRRGSAVPAQGR